MKGMTRITVTGKLGGSQGIELIDQRCLTGLEEKNARRLLGVLKMEWASEVGINL